LVGPETEKYASLLDLNFVSMDVVTWN